MSVLDLEPTAETRLLDRLDEVAVKTVGKLVDSGSDLVETARASNESVHERTMS